MIPFFRKKGWPDIPFSEIKKRARMLVIDDSDFPYQTLFERDGYTLEKWPAGSRQSQEPRIMGVFQAEPLGSYHVSPTTT
jgi:hypothetical protein